jgi:PAS domain-containing protein
MSGSSRRHGRRRTGSTSARYKPAELVPVESIQPATFGATEILGSVAVGLVVLALVALIWMLTGPVIVEQGADMRDRAERSLSGQAATIAETVSNELQMIDQSLTIIQAAWKQDSDAVDLNVWQQRTPALTAVSDDLFIADDNHIVRRDIIPQAVGQGVGAAYLTFPHGILETFESNGTKTRDSLLIHATGGAPVEARQFLMYVVRSLDHPAGWVIGASYRSTELTKLFAQAALGFNPVVALVDSQNGNVQAVVGPSARRPKTDLSKSPLLAAMLRLNAGTWLGPTGIDDVERLHAFHRVANRDLIVVVAANWDEVMAPANALGEATRTLAGFASALVAAIGGLILWELYSIGRRRRRERIYARNKTENERLRSDEVLLTLRARVNAARLEAVVANVSDGIALFDSGQRLLQWNSVFGRMIGTELRPEMPLDTMLREKIAAAAEIAESEMDTEAEVARCIGLLLAGDPAGLPIGEPESEALILHSLLIEDGGFALLLNGIKEPQPEPEPAPSPRVSPEYWMVPPSRTSAPINW